MEASSSRPLSALILGIAGVLLALAVFWVGFMLAPAAVLLIGYLALSAGERARHREVAQSSAVESAEAAGSRAAMQARAAGEQGAPAMSRPGAQIGARRGAEMGASREAAAPVEQELAQAGYVSQSRGART